VQVGPIASQANPKCIFQSDPPPDKVPTISYCISEGGNPDTLDDPPDTKAKIIIKLTTDTDVFDPWYALLFDDDISRCNPALVNGGMTQIHSRGVKDWPAKRTCAFHFQSGVLFSRNIWVTVGVSSRVPIHLAQIRGGYVKYPSSPEQKFVSLAACN
jgi:hypothetical protein